MLEFFQGTNESMNRLLQLKGTFVEVHATSRGANFNMSLAAYLVCVEEGMYFGAANGRFGGWKDCAGWDDSLITAQYSKPLGESLWLCDSLSPWVLVCLFFPIILLHTRPAACTLCLSCMVCLGVYSGETDQYAANHAGTPLHAPVYTQAKAGGNIAAGSWSRTFTSGTRVLVVPSGRPPAGGKKLPGGCCVWWGDGTTLGNLCHTSV